MLLYNKKLWKDFSKSVIELDGYKCQYCGKTSSETTLQVHHKRYKSGLKPWEYPLSDCETVCKGCHASIHGKITPKFGWEFLGYEDLGDLTGTCEYCGNSIRYSYSIFHENWGTMEVGTMCCDNLTDSKIASNLKESQTKFAARKARFIHSIRWKEEEGGHSIKHGNFEIRVFEEEGNYYLEICGYCSKTIYPRVAEAKSKAFEVIESGELVEYFKNKGVLLECYKKGKKPDGESMYPHGYQVIKSER